MRFVRHGPKTQIQMWKEIYHGILGRAKHGHACVTTKSGKQITIETDRITVIHRQRAMRIWCRECRCEVDAVEPEQAAALIAALQPKLESRSVAEGCHLAEAPDGSALICLTSLLRSL